jgi:hypothetical protein
VNGAIAELLARERRNGIFLHFCIEYGRWGTYGYGATGEKPGRWYCHLHRPYE